MVGHGQWLCGLSFLLFFARASMAVFKEDFEKDLNSFVEAILECRKIPGLTLAVVKGNETWTSGYGIADIDNNRPVDNSTVFLIGSITKSFTMILLGVLLMENSDKGWTFDTKLRDIMGPDYSFIDKYRTAEMTLRDMLSHRTGISEARGFAVHGGFLENISRKDYSKLTKFMPEAFPFRDRYEYSNHMYMMLGHVSEKIEGASWESLVTSKLFKPLGMSDSKILKKPDDVYTNKSAKPYNFRDGSFKNGTKSIYQIHPWEPAGAILSTANDMAKWLRFLLGDGKTPDGTRLIDKDMFMAARKTATPIDFSAVNQKRPQFPVSFEYDGYGYGLYTGHYRGYPLLWHSGGLWSYVSLMYLFPESNVGLFAAVNGHGLHFSEIFIANIFFHIIDELFQEPPWLDVTSACSYPEPWRNATKPSHDKEKYVAIGNPDEYVGRFGNRYTPSVKIVRDWNDNSTLLFLNGRMKGRLFGTVDKDRMVLEFFEPYEIVTTLYDGKNKTQGFNITFKRYEDVIVGFELHLGTKLYLEKGTNIGDYRVPLGTLLNREFSVGVADAQERGYDAMQPNYDAREQRSDLAMERSGEVTMR